VRVLREPEAEAAARRLQQEEEQQVGEHEQLQRLGRAAPPPRQPVHRELSRAQQERAHRAPERRVDARELLDRVRQEGAQRQVVGVDARLGALGAVSPRTVGPARRAARLLVRRRWADR
jgi:hypothetical protein